MILRDSIPQPLDTSVLVVFCETFKTFPTHFHWGKFLWKKPRFFAPNPEKSRNL